MLGREHSGKVSKNFIGNFNFWGISPWVITSANPFDFSVWLYNIQKGKLLKLVTQKNVLRCTLPSFENSHHLKFPKLLEVPKLTEDSEITVWWCASQNVFVNIFSRWAAKMSQFFLTLIFAIYWSLYCNSILCLCGKSEKGKVTFQERVLSLHS